MVMQDTGLTPVILNLNSVQTGPATTPYVVPAGQNLVITDFSVEMYAGASAIPTLAVGIALLGVGIVRSRRMSRFFSSPA